MGEFLDVFTSQTGELLDCRRPLWDKDERLKELERRLRTVSTENDKLKRLVAEKELELAILRELGTLPNPR